MLPISFYFYWLSRKRQIFSDWRRIWYLISTRPWKYYFLITVNHTVYLQVAENRDTRARIHATQSSSFPPFFDNDFKIEKLVMPIEQENFMFFAAPGTVSCTFERSVFPERLIVSLAVGICRKIERCLRATFYATDIYRRQKWISRSMVLRA